MTWSPPLTLEERIKNILIPPKIYIRHKVFKELKKGEKELHILPFLVNPDKISIDVGANKGVWSHVLSEISSTVYAFEPNPKLYRVLQKCMNNKVIAKNVALSNTSGYAELRIPKNKKGYSNQGSSLSEIKVSKNYKSIDVEIDTLDNFNIDRVGFIKIDVEGHELAVLEGAKKTIQKNMPIMIIEIEEKHTKKPIETLIEQVQSYGYDCFALKNGILTNFSNLDIEKHHRQHSVKKDYIFNFIFIPKSLNSL